MTTADAKAILRDYIEEKVKYTIPLQLAKAGATIAGIIGGAKAVDVGAEAYKKHLKRKIKKGKVKEAAPQKIGGIIKHRKMILKALKRGALGAAAWTAGEKLISGTAAVAKREKRYRELARLRAQRAKQKAQEK